MQNFRNIGFGLLSLLLLSAAPSQGKGGPATSSCQQLPADMQQFASGLSQLSQKLFCSVFNDDQRKAAMALSASLSPDMAVQKVAKDNGLLPQGKRSGGSCQVN